MSIARRGLTNIQESRILARKKFSKPVRITPSDMSKDIIMRHASKTTRAAKLAKMKAQDPVGMRKYDQKTKYNNATSNKLREDKYRRGLYDHI